MFLYNLTLAIYNFGILLASPFNKKARLWRAGRKGIWEKLDTDFKDQSSPVAWFHCASLGEFEQGRNLIESFKAKYPKYKIILTFFSPSGYEVRKSYTEAEFIYYLPLDTKSNASKFLTITKPKVAFFIKYEFWYHYINEAHKRAIPVISASSIFRHSQVYFKKNNSFWKKLFSKITFFYVQDEQSETLLEQIAITNTLITGDTRYDRVKTLLDNNKTLLDIESFKGNSRLVVLGSTWKQDIEVVKNALNNIGNDIKIVIAPHEINETNLKFIENNIVLSSERHSKHKVNTQNQVLIIDNIGMLSALYRYADICYIGGAFGKGLHNTLEAAAFGNPIIFGPKYDKFNEAKALIKRGGAFSVYSSENFKNTLDNLLNSTEAIDQAGNASKQLILENLGATEAILNHCDKFISE